MKNTIKIDNSKRKILIIGANGFLGSNILPFQNYEPFNDKNFFFIAADLENSNIRRDYPFYHMDITHSEDLFKKIYKISPEIVILTAAMSNVDQNEINKELATKINTEGPKNVVKACEKVNSKLIFLSTDFVFDGISKEGNYNEEDSPNPLNHYGRTKLNSELSIRNSNVDYLICRTAVLYGWNKYKNNFITWILNSLQNHKEISVITNQINNATFVVNLAQIILYLILKNANGIYHTAGDGSLSRYDMALKCADIFNYDKDLIIPTNTLRQKAIRPLNAGLDISKLKNKVGKDLMIYRLDDGLRYMKNYKIE